MFSVKKKLQIARKVLVSLTLIAFVLIIYSCEKDGSTGGKATITLFPEYDKSGSNIGTLTSIKGASVYIWFDGSNSTGLFGPKKDPESADLKVFGDTNETFVTIPNLKRGKYAWRILGSDPTFWKLLSGQGGREIKWNERKKNITIHSTLH